MKFKKAEKGNRYEDLENVVSKIRSVSSNTILDTQIKIQLSDIEADLEKMKTDEQSKNPYLKLLIRFTKLLLFIFTIKLVRNYIRTNETIAEQTKQIFNSDNIEQVIFTLAFSATLVAVLMLGVYLLLNFKKKTIMHSPFVLSLITFIFVDVVLVLVFPEVTINIFKAYLMGN